jgi:peptide/nickel transport system permease protein
MTSGVWRMLSRSWAARISFAVLVLLIAIAIAIPVLPLPDPWVGGRDALMPPGTPGHLLGTDELGRDVLSRVLWGTRVSLTVGLVVAFVTTVIGVVIGAIAGYFGGWIDSVLMRISEFFQSLPTIVVAIVVVALLGGGTDRLIVVIALLAWPQTARIVRSGFLSQRRAGYVDAAKVAGAGSIRIVSTEILPNVIAPVIVIATLDVAGAILIESSLSFFGLGNPNVVSWGGMLEQAQGYIRQAWWMSVFPGVMIATVVLAFNLFGDALNDALNPRKGGRA